MPRVCTVLITKSHNCLLFPRLPCCLSKDGVSIVQWPVTSWCPALELAPNGEIQSVPPQPCTWQPHASSCTIRLPTIKGHCSVRMLCIEKRTPSTACRARGHERLQAHGRFAHPGVSECRRQILDVWASIGKFLGVILSRHAKNLQNLQGFGKPKCRYHETPA